MRSTKLLCVCALLLGGVWLGGCADPAEEAEDSSMESPDAGGDVEADGDGAPTCQSEGAATPTDQCPSGVFNDDGICLAELPRLTDPEGCPGELSEDGVCLPLPPEPQRWSCPTGWVAATALELTDGEQTFDAEEEALLSQHQLCLPPEPAEGCAVGTTPALGTSECVPVGEPCPDGEPWHSAEALRERVGAGFEGAIRYVATEAEPDGDGSRERPLATIAAALALAEAGDVVALAPGRYEEAVALDAQVALVGACVEQTTIAAPEGESVTLTAAAWLGELSVTGAGVGVRLAAESGAAQVSGVRVSEAWGRGIVVASGSAALRRVVVADTNPDEAGEGFGIVVEAGSLEASELSVVGSEGRGVVVVAGQATLEDAIIRDTASSGAPGAGLWVEAAGEALTAERLYLAGNAGAGVVLSGPAAGARSEVVLRDAIVLDSAPGEGAGDGAGVWMAQGATLEAERLLVHRASDRGVQLVGGDGEALPVATLRDVVASHTRPNQDMQNGRGIESGPGCALEVARGLLLFNHTDGFWIDGADSQAHVSDLIVTHTQPRRDDLSRGRGLLVTAEGQLSGERVVLSYNHQQGALIHGGGLARLDDLSVLHSQPRESTLSGGSGVVAHEEGRLEGRRILLSHNRFLGLNLNGGHARVTDVVIEHTDSQAFGVNERGYYYGWGVGLLPYEGGSPTLVAERVAIVSNTEGGFGTARTSTAEVKDMIIRDTRPEAENSSRGAGLGFFSGSSFKGERILIARQYAAGMFAFTGATAEISDLTVSEVAPQQSDQNFGRGISVEETSTLTLERVTIEDVYDVGLVSWGDARVFGTDVVIRDVKQTLQSNASGNGVSAVERGTMDLNRFSISDSDVAGIQVATEGAFTATGGLVTDNFIGINVQIGGFDYNGLECVDINSNCCNEACDVLSCNVEDRDLPIPESATALADVSE